MNIVKADFFRLLKDKPVRVVFFIMLAINFLSVAVFKLLDFVSTALPEMSFTSTLAQMSYMSVFALGNLGVFIAIAASMFIGKDYQYNTIRLKLAGGNSRTKVFFSAFAINVIIGLFFFIVSFVESALLMLIFYGNFSIVSDTLAALALCIPVYLAVLAVMTMISMLLKSQAMGIVMNILIIVLVPAILSLVSMGVQMLDAPEFFEFLLSIVPYNIVGTLTGGTIFGGADGSVNIIFAQVDWVITLKAILSSAVLAAVALIIGCLMFKRAEMK